MEKLMKKLSGKEHILYGKVHFTTIPEHAVLKTGHSKVHLGSQTLSSPLVRLLLFVRSR